MAANQSLSELQRLSAEQQVSEGLSATELGLVLLASGNIPLLTDKVLVRAGSVRVHAYNIQNPTAAVAFVQFFNAASAAAVTLGTTQPSDWLAIPAGGVVDGYWPKSPSYNAGLVIAATTGPNTGVLVGTGLPVSLGVI